MVVFGRDNDAVGPLDTFFMRSRNSFFQRWKQLKAGKFGISKLWHNFHFCPVVGNGID
eukprot:Awhi_evm1s12997